jgi:glycerol uptake facilitator-like aquaporin
VSIARSLSNSFAGIDPNSVPAFIAMQIIGAILGYSIIRWIFVQESKS